MKQRKQWHSMVSSINNLRKTFPLPLPYRFRYKLQRAKFKDSPSTRLPAYAGDDRYSVDQCSGIGRNKHRRPRFSSQNLYWRAAELFERRPGESVENGAGNSITFT